MLLLLLAGCPRPVEIGAAPTRVGAPLDGESRAVLLAGAADLDVEVRRVAIATLIEADPTWAPRGRYDPSPAVQRATIATLAAAPPSPPAVEVLAGLTRDPGVDPFTRGFAARAWLQVAPDAEPEIRALAMAEPRDDRAAGLLAATPDPAARARLAGWLAGGELPYEPEVVRFFATAELAAALGSALPKVEPELRLQVAGALLPWAPELGLPELRAGLRDPEIETRLEALDVLEESPAPAAVELLTEARLALDPLVRERASLALAGRGVASTRVLGPALEDEERELRLAALRAVEDAHERGLDVPDRTRARVRSLVQSEDPAEQIAAIRALGASPDPADRAALEAQLGDESLRVRVYVVAALR